MDLEGRIATLSVATDKEKVTDAEALAGEEEPEWDDDDVEYEWGVEDEEEDVEYEDVTEDQLIAMLDSQCDPFTLCSGLFHVDADFFEAADGAVKQLSCLAPKDAHAFFSNGYVVVDDFLQSDYASSLFDATLSMRQEGSIMKPAWENRDDDKFRDGKARGDYTTWLHSPSANSAAQPNPPAFDKYLSVFEKVRADLGVLMKLNNADPEYQVAYYPSTGAHYEKHRDGLPDDGCTLQQRRVTAICYTSKAWKPEDGGVLRLENRDGDQVNVEPRAGRLLLFLSGAVYHEVRPAHSERVAVTAWFQ